MGKVIDRYYQDLFALLKLSKRLTEEEKIGQRAFLSQEWERELLPFFNFWSVKVYEQNASGFIPPLKFSTHCVEN